MGAIVVTYRGVSWVVAGAVVLLGVLTSCGDDGVAVVTTAMESVPTTTVFASTKTTLVASTTMAPSSTTYATTAEPTCLTEPVIEGLGEGPGPYFVCTMHPYQDAGHVFSRDGVTTAEGAILEWLKGPTSDEVAAGYDGYAFTGYEWLIESLTLRREGNRLIMEVADWEPIAETSTSSGLFSFMTGLTGTAFSDPTVAEFFLSIAGNSCPLYLGDGEFCFPIQRDDVTFYSIP